MRSKDFVLREPLIEIQESQMAREKGNQKDQKGKKVPGKPAGQQAPKVIKPKGPRPESYLPREKRIVENALKVFSPLSQLNGFPVGKSFKVLEGTNDETIILVTTHKVDVNVMIDVIKPLRSKNPLIAEMAKKELWLSVNASRVKDEKFIKKDSVPQVVFDRQVELRRILRLAIEAAKNVTMEPVKAEASATETQTTIEQPLETTELAKATTGEMTAEELGLKEKKQLMLQKRALAQKGPEAVKKLKKMEYGFYHVGVHGTVVEVKQHPSVTHLKMVSLVFSEHLGLRDMVTGLPVKLMMSEGIMNQLVMPEKLDSKTEEEYYRLAILHSIIQNAFSKVAIDSLSITANETKMDAPVVVPEPVLPAVKVGERVVFSKEDAVPLGSVKMTNDTVGLFYVRAGSGRAYMEAQFGRLTLTELSKTVPKDHYFRKIISIYGGKIFIPLLACNQKASEKEVVDLKNPIEAKRYLHQVAYGKCAGNVVKPLPVTKTEQQPAEASEEATRPRYVEQVPEGVVMAHAVKKLLGIEHAPA